MSFLSIPSEEGLFTTIKTRKSPGEEAAGSDDEEEDDDTEVIRLIPRCSPVPRKRGASIYDETAEYMRIHLALSAGKRVSFADTTGGDLTDVKEFTAFDTDEEEDGARWEEEEARKEPRYSVRPGFTALAGDALLRAVRTHKVEVEEISPVENEPLSFSGVVRVSNISFHKAVYVRATSDNWVTHFDHPAEYVHGSHDGDTDQFSFKLSFAPPYVTDGSRIEFVVRYETSEGDFWANNFSMNYAVSLLLSYEDHSEQPTISAPQTRGILKPPKVYSANDGFDSEDEQEKTGEEAGATQPGLFRPVPVCPVIVQPELDIERGTDPEGPSVLPDPDLPGDRVPSEAPPPAHSPRVPPTSVSLRPEKLQPCCEFSSRPSEEPAGSGASAEPAAPPPPPRQDRADAEEGRPSEDSCVNIPATDTALEQEKTSPKPPSHACTSAPGVTFDLEVAEGIREPAEDSTVVFPAAEGQTRLRSEGESPASPETADDQTVSPRVSAPSQSPQEQHVPETQDASHSPLNSPAELCQLRAEPDVGRSLVSSAVLLGGIVSLSVVLQEPSTLFFIGLLLVLRRL